MGCHLDQPSQIHPYGYQEKTIHYFKTTYPSIHETNDLFKKLSINETEQKESLAQILKKSEVKIEDILDFNLIQNSEVSEIKQNKESLEQVEIELKYEGYIKRQVDQIEKFKKFENKMIPENIDYFSIPALSKESSEKLSKVKPRSIGQAMRVSGVTPSDVSVIMIFIEKKKQLQKRALNA